MNLAEVVARNDARGATASHERRKLAEMQCTREAKMGHRVRLLADATSPALASSAAT